MKKYERVISRASYGKGRVYPIIRLKKDSQLKPGDKVNVYQGEDFLIIAKQGTERDTRCMELMESIDEAENENKHE